MSLTTLRFFALQAEHRGFKGDEVDAAWKALREHEAEATFLTLARRIPRVMMTQADRVARASRVDLAIAKKTTTLAAELRQEQQAVADLKAELTALKVQLNDERAGRAEVSATILLQERQIVDMRAEAAVAQTHATDVAAALREDLKSERELVVVMSARAEAAEVNASTQASTLHEQKGIIADLEGGLSQCERLVEAERARREEAAAADRKTAADIAIVVQDLKAERELVAKLSARVESAEESSLCVATISQLLGETPAGAISFTTLRFVALQAEHRGFTGDEVDAAWAALQQHEAEATFFTLARRIPREMMARASRVVLAMANDAAYQAFTLHQQEIIADLEVEISQWGRLVETERAGREEAVAMIKLQEKKIDKLRAGAVVGYKTAADIAVVVQDLKAERELVATLSGRVESAESNARAQASTVREKEEAITDIQTELAKCELLVETERAHAAATLAAAEEHHEFRRQLLKDVLDTAEATEMILDIAQANVKRLISVEESLRAELVVAKEETQVNLDMWEVERAETRAEYAAAIATAKHMEKTLAVLRAEGLERKMAIAALAATLRSATDDALSGCKSAKMEKEADGMRPSRTANAIPGDTALKDHEGDETAAGEQPCAEPLAEEGDYTAEGD